MNKLLFALFALLNLSIVISAIPTKEQICYNDVAGFNKGVNKLLDDILAAKDVWEIFSDLDSLDEVSYHLKTSCEDFALDLLVKQTPGQNASQYQACGYLVGIVGSLLEENKIPGFRGTPEGGVLLSQEAAGLGALLTKDCKITLAIDTSKAAEAESESEEEEEEETKAEDDENEENEAKGEGEEVQKRELGGKSKGKKEEEKGKEKEEKKHKKEKKEESDDKEDDSSDSDDEDEDDNKGIRLQLGDAHDGKNDQFTVQYTPSNKGAPEINIQHSSVDLAQEEEDSDDSDEPDYLINLIEVSKPGDADSGAQWKGGDYNKYMNVSDWQTGGFKRFYEAGMGDEEDDGEVPPVLLDI